MINYILMHYKSFIHATRISDLKIYFTYFISFVIMNQ